MTNRIDVPSAEDLVRRARTGSSAAFGELVARYESVLFNFLLRRTSSAEDAEEIAQDAFVRAWQKIDSYDARWKFSTWLFTLARRLAATRMRSSSSSDGLSSQGHEALAGVPVHADPGLDLTRTEERTNLWSIVDRVLDADQRSALWLRYAEDLTVAEIAEVLGRSSVSVRVMLFRARAKLEQHLEPPRTDSSAVAPLAKDTQWRKVGI
jgi:RNA polymerase sigma-70 factor (ECF subfamily)